MVLDFFKSSSDADAMDSVEAQIVQMVRDARTVYSASMSAVFGGGESTEVKQEVKQVDQGINEAQQAVRRTLMLHASVKGDVDLPLVLAYMSVVKDAERMGDYAKNLYDLAKFGVDFEAAPDRAELESYSTNVDRLLEEAADSFENMDSPRAAELIDKADGFLDDYDERVRAAYTSQGPASDAVARALYYRFLKRITAHVMNLLTSLVKPVDQLDYYDESKDDRD